MFRFIDLFMPRIKQLMEGCEVESGIFASHITAKHKNLIVAIDTDILKNYYKRNDYLGLENYISEVAKSLKSGKVYA